MRQFLSGITRREKRFAVAGIVIALVFGFPLLAFADPGLVPGTTPTAEVPLDVTRGQSCRDLLPADTPSFVVCRWLTPPQEAAAVAAFWGANGGANLEAARPLPQQYIRCNQRTDFATSTNCRGGQTACKELGDGWYQCRNGVTGEVTYERYVNGTKVVQTTAPTISPTSSAPTALPTVSVLPTSSLSPIPVPTVSVVPTPAPTVSVVPTPVPTAVPTASPMTAAIDAAHAANLRTWVEADLAGAYKAGDVRFQSALATLITHARQPGVAGVKFADNLGYRDLTSATEIRAFLTAATTALRNALPGKRLSISVVVPELGCGANQKCVSAMRAKYPVITKQQVDGYIRAADVDRVYVASGLFGTTYAAYGITPAKAAQAQWLAVKALGWDTLVQIGSREYGLAHQGDTSGWDKATADGQISARVGTALGLGVQTVTLWGHSSSSYRLLNAGLAPNEVWRALTGYRSRLSATFDPGKPEISVEADIRTLATTVSEIFLLST
ncbi:hypothetical protein ACIBG8_37135 [Nonomuraea sp. NPDC050556]|uniref:hypothetical protein n=1 Tax=Nonomuraea sp. NPDC050556 TaxID=3364369 RepID=UPI0037A4B3F7